MQYRRVLARMTLALLLIWMQQWALAHAITHISRPIEYETQPDERLPGELHCIQCLAFASVGIALATAAFSWPGGVAGRWITVAGATADPDCAHRRVFDSRAPPIYV